jgi:hypothetical protein
VPAALVDHLVHEAHTSQLTGHEGISKTKERLLQSYFWPNMDADVALHTEACHHCQNLRCHMDLFGPLKTSNEGKKFVLCITGAFTKYTEIIAIKNKEASTITKRRI